MWKNWFTVALCTALAPACVVYDVGPSPSSNTGGGVVTNTAPRVDWASTGCYWDSYYQDDIWYFEADVFDADSIWDITEVYADVYDSWTGEWVDSFQLYETNDPSVFFSDWLGKSTYLDCFYSGYEVDIVVYDSFKEYDVMTVYPDTYGYY